MWNNVFYTLLFFRKSKKKNEKMKKTKKKKKLSFCWNVGFDSLCCSSFATNDLHSPHCQRRGDCWGNRCSGRRINLTFLWRKTHTHTPLKRFLCMEGEEDKSTFNDIYGAMARGTITDVRREWNDCLRFACQHNCRPKRQTTRALRLHPASATTPHTHTHTHIEC